MIQTISFILVWVWIFISIKLMIEANKLRKYQIELELLKLLDKYGFEYQIEEIYDDIPRLLKWSIFILVIVSLSRIIEYILITF